jgi:hypothetical protein
MWCYTVERLASHAFDHSLVMVVGVVIVVVVVVVVVAFAHVAVSGLSFCIAQATTASGDGWRCIANAFTKV